MKRVWIVMLAVVLTLTVLTACQSDKDKASSGASVDLNKVMTDINSNYDLGEMKTVEDTKGLNRYYKVEADDVKQFAAEFSPSGTDYTEVIMIEGTDADATGRIADALSEHLNKQLIDAKRYHPDKVTSLEACEVQQSDNFVYLVICDQYDDIVNTISEALH